MREGCLRAEGCLATAEGYSALGAARALGVLCVPWARLDGVRRAALCAMPDRGLVSFPNLLVTKNAHLLKLVYERLESYSGPH